MGLYTGVDYDSPYLIVNSVVRYPLPLQRERGRAERSLPLVEHSFISLLISKTTNRSRKRDGGRGGEERGESWLMSLNIHFMEHGH
jgi:hypothetical protein